MASVVKQEYAPNTSAIDIYSIKPVLESDNLETWIGSAHIDKFILILPKTWDMMLKADHTQNYNFMGSMNPNRIIQENKAIPLYFFEYCMQENMAKHGDQAQEKKMCFRIYRSRLSRYDALSSRNVSDQKRT